ncbi:hypothetical protein CH272_17175 [Rhodococcus sp. 05-340-1]|jgi:hypothetical protein|uniref:hypothetical protein n=1 Tax=unclassified Rhodococcus (in: high G+C Gram-positive bacteria) TaxID=192944 RepID=UPI000B9B6955|nr:MULTISPECIES: hypothetical protein [unclassified Rhodococcus (in: high G+C Gram-positive bacteria)]OZD63461.1 hypothetical protein CH271_22785 [Rhodococcus sp. 05-340-2]OZD75501.1 hypothetical protein CH272_17175 [Rhodococcus sp. 05-340-1]
MALRWVSVAAIGLATASATALLAWLVSPVAPGIAAVVFGFTALPFGAMLGWILIIAPVTADQTYTSGDSVESHWTTSASSGTATDLVTVLGLTLAVVAITRVDPPATLLLTGLLLAAFASFTARYALARHRALSE